MRNAFCQALQNTEPGVSQKAVSTKDEHSCCLSLRNSCFKTSSISPIALPGCLKQGHYVYLGKHLINSFVKSRTVESAFPQWWLVRLCCCSLKFPSPAHTMTPSISALFISSVLKWDAVFAVSLSLLVTCWKASFSNSVPGGLNKWACGGLARPGGLQPAS